MSPAAGAKECSLEFKDCDGLGSLFVKEIYGIAAGKLRISWELVECSEECTDLW